mgnify:CR=1 FL=1
MARCQNQGMDMTINARMQAVRAAHHYAKQLRDSAATLNLAAELFLKVAGRMEEFKLSPHDIRQAVHMCAVLSGLTAGLKWLEQSDDLNTEQGLIGPRENDASHRAD